MKICIHRGTNEIGGSCVEFEHDGERIVVDLGLPLDAGRDHSLPPVPGLSEAEVSLRAIVLSHGHRDHWGLIPKVAANVPIVTGAGTERIMRAAAAFVPEGFAPKVSQHLVDRRRIEIGPFSITPYLADHSGFDAYSLLVQAGGKSVFYSGDLRSHGRKGVLFERLVASPPVGVDVMLMEGSSLGRIPDGHDFPTEKVLEEKFVASMKATPGMVLVACSAQNIDRVVTVYRAAKRTGRTLLVDAYAAEVLKATGIPSIPKPDADWHDVKVFIPQRQRVMLKRAGIAALVDAYKGRRVWSQELAGSAGSSVMLVRPWMMKELAELGALASARVIWSQWDGYLKDGPGRDFRDDCAARELPFEQIHTSGHASPSDLVRLAQAIAPRQLIPIHTFEKHRYPALFENALILEDGEWLKI